MTTPARNRRQSKATHSPSILPRILNNSLTDDSSRLRFSVHCLLAFAVRLLLIAYGEYQDRVLRVSYTDIDYVVFSEAAKHVTNGQSPYVREDYRYTPLLAYLLTPNLFLFAAFGKVLFSGVDIAVGVLLHRAVGGGRSSSLLWLYNPIVINISTRGNAEAVMALLTVGSVVALLERRNRLAALLFGLSVHFKMYPLCYSLALYLAVRFYELSPSTLRRQSIRPTNRFTIRAILPSGRQMEFVALSAFAFLIPTCAFYYQFGYTFLDQTYLYHFRRVDTQHNFSIYFYLLRTENAMLLRLLGVGAFLLQAAFALYFAIRFRAQPHVAAFFSTLAFVALNKVITVQYFVWYFAFLPLVPLRIGVAEGVALFGAWLAAMAHWLYQAYLLEFEQQLEKAFTVWIASILFLAAHLVIINRLLRATRHVKTH